MERFVIVKIYSHKNGTIATKATFIHNIKVKNPK